VPVHPFADGFNFIDGSTRDCNEGNVVVLQVREKSLDMVDFKRAPDALLFLAGSHHEMFDEELAAAVEQLREGDFPEGPSKTYSFSTLTMAIRAARR
jgi:hypothetical protein